MNWKQHLTFGGLLAVSAQLLAVHYHSTPLQSMNVIQDIEFYAPVLLGSLVPDIDHPSSKLGYRIWGWMVPKDSREKIAKLTHRKFTHSLLFLFLLWWGLSKLHTPYFIMAGILFGAITHFIGDMLTPMGIPLAYPIRKRFRIFPLIRS